MRVRCKSYIHQCHQRVPGNLLGRLVNTARSQTKNEIAEMVPILQQGGMTQIAELIREE